MPGTKWISIEKSGNLFIDRYSEHQIARMLYIYIYSALFPFYMQKPVQMLTEKDLDPKGSIYCGE